MIRPRVLVAGIGNIFLGDDAFGVEVVKELARRSLPDQVKVVDFGIRGLDLTYALLDGYEAAILVDAAPRGVAPGTLHVLEPEPAEPSDSDLAVEGHNLDPARVLRLAAALGGAVKRLLVVGCEPTPMHDADDMAMGLSGPVQAAVGEAANLVEALLAQLLAAPRGETIADTE